MFYPKLAWTNIKKNGKTYIPYILTGILTIMMLYVMIAISLNTGLDQMEGSNVLKLILRWAATITGIFSAIFLFYTNSFLVKQRKKEFGLYQVLGMDKGNLAKMMVWETVLTTVISLLMGLGLGMLLGKLMFLILLKMLRFEVPLKFAVEPQAMLATMIVFLAVFTVTLLFNLLQVQTAKPVELLHGGSQGEKEPKTKRLLTLIGVLTLGAGYYIAQTTVSPLEAIGKFFMAVILVIIGTYCLFTAGSIALLKILKKNKKFYYKTSHFTSVSGLIYRMKQNAVGLANICIMSTVVLVLISVTFSLYAGMEDILSLRFPSDVHVTIQGSSQEKIDTENQVIEEEAEKAGVEIENRSSYRSGTFTAIYKEKEARLLLEEDSDISNETANFRTLVIIPLSDYNRLEGKKESLDKDQVLVIVQGDEFDSDTIYLQDEGFAVKKVMKDTRKTKDELSYVVKSIILVMPDADKIAELKKTYGYEGSDQIIYTDYFDLSGSGDAKESVMASIQKRLTAEIPESFTEYKGAFRQDFYALYGGFLFLGVFVGALFIMATVLIIYYKQISEGYDDRNRYQIMQKVGMSKKEVQRSIKSQVLLVFFLPLLVAIVHVAFAFKTITKLLAIMNLVNIHLFLMCTIATVLIFAVFYGVVFLITSREYYRIVQ